MSNRVSQKFLSESIVWIYIYRVDIHIFYECIFVCMYIQDKSVYG